MVSLMALLKVQSYLGTISVGLIIGFNVRDKKYWVHQMTQSMAHFLDVVRRKHPAKYVVSFFVRRPTASSIDATLLTFASRIRSRKF